MMKPFAEIAFLSFFAAGAVVALSQSFFIGSDAMHDTKPSFFVRV